MNPTATINMVGCGETRERGSRDRQLPSSSEGVAGKGVPGSARKGELLLRLIAAYLDFPHLLTWRVGERQCDAMLQGWGVVGLMPHLRHVILETVWDMSVRKNSNNTAS